MDKSTRKEFADIRSRLKDVLKKSRYEHTLGVEFTSAALAMRYGVDLYKARMAGLLHDCAKNFTDEKLLELCKKYKLGISETEKRIPYLLHGKLGAYLAKKEYKIKDTEILNAIEFHTTGRENMSMLEKIIFTADYIEPGRDKAPNLAKIRKMAFEDIDKAVLMIFDDTISYILSNNQELDSVTLNAYNYLKNELELKKKEERSIYDI
ncbi:MAG: bis(5'-nucleosyl)-tetraphosphatase (symmetrical) YqeK [Lachnospiraceae bacterium]